MMIMIACHTLHSHPPFYTENGNFPIGHDELKTIERRRERRMFEAALPPITDEASFKVRRRMMEEQELREMAYKEEKIDEKHVSCQWFTVFRV